MFLRYSFLFFFSLFIHLFVVRCMCEPKVSLRQHPPLTACRSKCKDTHSLNFLTETFHSVFWLPLDTCDEHTPALWDNGFLSGDHSSPPFHGVDIDLVGRVGFLRGANKNNYQKKKKSHQRPDCLLCTWIHTVCDKDKRKDPRLCVWSQHVREISLKAGRKFVPENLILTVCCYGAKNGERVNENSPFLNIITGLYRSWFENSRKGKEPTLVPEIPLWYSYLSLSLIVLLVLLRQRMTQQHKWTVILVLLQTGEKEGLGGGVEFWLEHMPWDLVKCTRLSSESTWLHSTNDCIKRATESLFVGTRVRERVRAKAKTCSVRWTAGMSGPGTSASHGWVFLWQRGHWWRHLLFGADGDLWFKSLGGSRLEYKLDLKKLD